MFAMRRLVLFRHAKAERTAPSGEDFDRELTERGRQDARLIGQALTEAGISPGLALVSAAARTRQTWQASGLAGEKTAVRYDKALYHASARQLREAIEAVEEEAEVVVLVGHNPGLHELAVQLVVEGAGSGAVLEKVRSKFPTAAAVVYDLDLVGRAVFGGLYTPKDYGGGAED
jgi:phosphohistidine phosphatase